MWVGLAPVLIDSGEVCACDGSRQMQSGSYVGRQSFDVKSSSMQYARDRTSGGWGHKVQERSGGEWSRRLQLQP